VVAASLSALIGAADFPTVKTGTLFDPLGGQATYSRIRVM
jgi:hypothetical protein